MTPHETGSTVTPRCPPRGTATAHVRPPGADPGRPHRRLSPGLPGAAVSVPQHRPRPGRPSHRVLRPRRAGRRAHHAPDPPVSTDPARCRAATGTINRETSALHRMGTLAVHWGWLDTVPGFPDRLRENPPRQGFFEHPEYLAVRAHLPDPWQDILDLAYYSGWRKQEILGLSWDEIR